MRADLRLAVPAALGWIATAILVGQPDASVPVLVAAWLTAGLLVVVRPRLALAALVVALCCTSIAVGQSARQPSTLVTAAAEGTRVTVTGVITGTARPGGTSFEMTGNAVSDGDVETTGAIPLLVFGAAPRERLGIGTTVELIGRLGAAGAGDDRAFLLFPDAPPDVLAPPPWYLAWADGLRETLIAVAADLPGDGGDLVPGLAVGDTGAVSEGLDTAMTTSSLSHLTAVSGANCAIVIGLIMLAGAALGLPRGARVGASLVVLVAFVVLVTPEPSVLRAAVMAALVLVALLAGRPVRGLPVLALATVVLLIADPWLSRQFGFVLSVLSSVGLLLLAGPLGTALAHWMPRWIALVVAVPFAAQLACQPVVILLDASIPTYGVLANVLAVPAAPLATIAGLAACVTSAILPPVGTVLAWIAWVPAAWIAAVARFFAGAPGARLPWVPGAGGVVLLVLLSTLVVLALLGRARWRRAAAGAAVLGAVVYLGIVGGARLGELAGRPAHWQLAACDVGQGDAVVVRSAGVVALIDTGPEPAPLAACLDDLGIARVDLLVLTHYDLDHVGGVAAVAGRADRVLVGPSGSADDDRMVADLIAAGARVEQVSRGAEGMLGELRWRVLWPPVRLAGLEPGNEASVTVEFDPVGECAAGCFSSLFLGDLGEGAQERMLALGRIDPVDVVKVSHHGSSDQSEQLYLRLGAVLGVIGVGADNGYGHPTDRALGMLAAAGTAVARTDEDGLVLVAPGDELGTVTVWRER